MAFRLDTYQAIMRETQPYQRDVTEKVEAGWTIEEETSDRVVLVRRAVGSPTIHLLLAVFTIWWAMGIPNVLYAAYKWVADSERTIVWKASSEGGDSTSATG